MEGGVGFADKFLLRDSFVLIVRKHILNKGEGSMTEIVFGQEVQVDGKAARRIAKFLSGDNPDEYKAFKVVLRAAEGKVSSGCQSVNGNGHLTKKPSKEPATCRRTLRPAFGRFHA